jgi:hypothetical protein
MTSVAAAIAIYPEVVRLTGQFIDRRDRAATSPGPGVTAETQGCLRSDGNHRPWPATHPRHGK